jgi:hypothetical protein
MATGVGHGTSLHDLRGHLNTVRLSASLLEAERDLTESGRIALKRIELALDHATHELVEIEAALEPAAE